MALGFDMADPIVDPNRNVNQRINEWNSFFLRWNHKPEFAGRYFIERYNKEGELMFSPINWIDGEIPRDIRTTIPNFSELKYILPFGPSGEEIRSIEVNWDGTLSQVVDPNSNQRPLFYQQSGYQQYGKNTNNYKKIPTENSIIIRNWAMQDAWSTCKQIAQRLEGVLDTCPAGAQFRLPESKQVFIFLSVEPWTRLHPDYWLMWSSAIEVYPVSIILDDQLVVMQPFRPCLYFNIPTEYEANHSHQAFREFNTRIFSQNIGRCHALMSAPFASVTWLAYIRNDGTVTKSEIFALNEEGVEKPTFISLQQNEGSYPDANVLLWQYFIGDRNDDIDLSVTTEEKYNEKLVSDFMLEIIW